MRTLVHLSDLHFGRTSPATLERLPEAVATLQPDLVVITGDFTQRARVGQFREAARFLERLPRPQLLIPGNHDVPLYNLAERFLDPFGAYRRGLHDDLEPFFEDESICVVGVNSVNPWVVEDGRLPRASLERARTRFAAAKPGALKIVASHHPLDMFAGPVAPRARHVPAAALLELEPDLVLSGHLHRHLSADSNGVESGGHRSFVVAHAGTTTSTRLKGDANSFHCLRLEPTRIEIETFLFGEAGFVRGGLNAFVLGIDGWTRLVP